MSRSTNSSSSAPSLSPIAEQPESNSEDDRSPLRQLRNSLANLSLNNSKTHGKSKRKRPKKGINRRKMAQMQFYRSIYSIFRSVFPRQQTPQNGSASPAERVEVNREGPSSISTSAMCVLNTMVKELIIRFAQETNQLLDHASGRFSTLDAPEALSAIRMIFGANVHQFNTVVMRFGQLSANMPSRRRLRKQPPQRQAKAKVHKNKT